MTTNKEVLLTYPDKEVRIMYYNKEVRVLYPNKEVRIFYPTKKGTGKVSIEKMTETYPIPLYHDHNKYGQGEWKVTLSNGIEECCYPIKKDYTEEEAEKALYAFAYERLEAYNSSPDELTTENTTFSYSFTSEYPSGFVTDPRLAAYYPNMPNKKLEVLIRELEEKIGIALPNLSFTRKHYIRGTVEYIEKYAETLRSKGFYVERR